jgi:hypothetical protein
MARTTGKVQALKLSTTRGFVELRRADSDSPRTEVFIIWFGDESRGPSALYTTQLTTAMARQLDVTIFHEDDGAYIEDLTIRAPAG